MLRRLINKVFGVNDYSPKREIIDWAPIITHIRDHIGNHSVWLELPQGGWRKLESADETTSATGIAVAYVAEGVKSWDTEAPAKHMAEKLSELLGKELPILLSRDYEHFVGYYVYISK